MQRVASSKRELVTGWRKKKAMLGCLVLLAAVAVGYQVGSNRPPAVSSQPTRSRISAEVPAVPNSTALRPLASAELLDLSLSAPPGASRGVHRNIFEYAMRRTRKTEDIVPPIKLTHVEPGTAVAGTPRSFTLTAAGEEFPVDAEIVFGGIPKPTRLAGDTGATTEVSPSEYALPRAVTVEVRSRSKPGQLYSNTLVITVQRQPEPPFRFVGMIGDLGVFEMAVAARATEHLRLRRGSIIDSVWRIESIGDAGAEVTDLRYETRKRVPL